MGTKARLDMEMRERWTMDKKIKEDQARLAAQEEALAAAEAKRVSSSSSLSSSSSSASRGSSSTFSREGSSSSSSWSTSSSSYSRGSGGGQAQGQMFFGRNSPISSGPLFSSVNTTFGQTPIVYERRYEYSQSSHNRG